MRLFSTIFFLIVLTGLADAQIDCNSWGKFQNRLDAVTVGDLDVTGNHVTVEASFTMTGPSVDIVSKHRGSTDLNYLLRPTRAEISTNVSGFVVTNEGSSSCNDVLALNKTYHAALVYDGNTLKFYRNGALISQVPASGNLLTNNWEMAIGEQAIAVTPFVNGVPNPDYQNTNAGNGFNDESFKGYINEVRVWNVARTQDEIKAYMNTSLPDPTTQVGLLGYWVLSDLINKQGNTAYNGRIEGSATIGQTNGICGFIADSCNIVLPVRITDFNASVFEKKEMKLSWNTAGESGIGSYTIQRGESSDFRNAVNLGTVNSANNGTTNHYTFSDNSLLKNKLYFYRLKINEKAGSTTWSDVKSGKISASTLLVDFYPNPTKNGLVNLQFNDISGNAIITVSNSTGQILLNKKVLASSGGTVILNLKKYQKGSYFITVMTSDNKIVRKIINL